jgi:hypothetical protein
MILVGGTDTAEAIVMWLRTSDSRWARLLDTAIEYARFTRLHELYERHHAGGIIGYGPGTEKFADTFDAVKRAADEATRTVKSGDKRTEYDFLRKTRVSLGFGKLNHCTFDQNRPSQASPNWVAGGGLVRLVHHQIARVPLARTEHPLVP